MEKNLFAFRNDAGYLIDFVVELSDERLEIHPVRGQQLDGDLQLTSVRFAQVNLRESAHAQQPVLAEPV